VIPLRTQLLPDSTDRVRGRRHLLTGLGRAGVQFLPDALAGLTSNLLSLLPGLLSRLLDALFRLLRRGLLRAISAACGGLFHIRHEPLLGWWFKPCRRLAGDLNLGRVLNFWH
jgi:hypothetical protein